MPRVRALKLQTAKLHGVLLKYQDTVITIISHQTEVLVINDFSKRWAGIMKMTKYNSDFLV